MRPRWKKRARVRETKTGVRYVTWGGGKKVYLGDEYHSTRRRHTRKLRRLAGAICATLLLCFLLTL